MARADGQLFLGSERVGTGTCAGWRRIVATLYSLRSFAAVVDHRIFIVGERRMPSLVATDEASNRIVTPPTGSVFPWPAQVRRNDWR